METLIADGSIKVNGKVASLGDQVGEGDRIETPIHNYLVELKGEPTRALLMNKKIGVVCTRRDPEGRPTVFDNLPRGRWINIGRLDINTSGLLMLTNDGELAHTMMHPSNGVDREYACRIHGEVDEEMIQRLLGGVALEDGEACFTDVVASGGEGENQWFHVALMEGRNREVRRLWESQGVQVSRLKRVRYGAVFLPSRLKVGMWEEMHPNDIRILREDVGLPGKPPVTLQLKGLRR